MTLTMSMSLSSTVWHNLQIYGVIFEVETYKGMAVICKLVDDDPDMEVVRVLYAQLAVLTGITRCSACMHVAHV